MNKLVLVALLVIIVSSSVFLKSTTAYFSDVKVLGNNTFSTGSWGRVVINEIYYHDQSEWLELHNSGQVTVDVRGWFICDGLGNCGSLNPRAKTLIEPDGFLLVAHDAKVFKDWEIAKEVERVYYSGPKIDFNDAGDLFMLKDDQENIVDLISYGSNITAFDPSINLVDIGYSLQRNPIGFDQNLASDFIGLENPTPGF